MTGPRRTSPASLAARDAVTQLTREACELRDRATRARVAGHDPEADALDQQSREKLSAAQWWRDRKW